MPSTGSQSTSVENQSGWSNRYGLPSWMRCNIDRLNVCTNFEEYACSPPETDSGFIPDFDAKCATPIIGEKSHLSKATSALKTSRSAPMLSDLERSAQQHELSKALKEATKQSFLANRAALAVPHILGTQSASTSTETTPCTTPQGSPFNVRKATALKDDAPKSPGSSSKQWFYPGMLADKGTSGENMPMLSENPDGPATTEKKRDRLQKMPLTAKGYKKYMVSNFDLNAVSPTSW